MSSKKQFKCTLDHLIRCLEEPANYKLTKHYLEEASGGNEQTQAIISNAILHVMQSKNIQITAKMHALKLFKDVFESGNMDLVDALDEKIEQQIMKAAAYRKDKKIAERGQTYFMETEKREQSSQTKLIGMSYVILALEMVQNFGEWYERNEQNQQSRFKTYKKLLQQRGVSFPEKMSYFKPTDRARFETNYSKWKASISSVGPPPAVNKKQLELSGSMTGSQLGGSVMGLPLDSQLPDTPTKGKGSFFSSKHDHPKQPKQQLPKEKHIVPPQRQNQLNREQDERFRAGSHSNGANEGHVKHLTEQNAKLKKQLESSAAEIQRLKSQLKQQKQEAVNLKAENANLADQLKQAQAYQSKAVKLSSSNEQTARAMVTLKKEHTAALQKRQDRLKQLEEELAEARQELGYAKEDHSKRQAELTNRLQQLQKEPAYTQNGLLGKRLLEQATRADALKENLAHSREHESELNEEIQRLRKQVSKLKNEKSLTNLSSEREPTLENKVLKEKCRLLELRLRDIDNVSPAPSKQVIMVRTEKHSSSQELQYNPLQFQQTGNNFFMSRSRMAKISSMSRRTRFNNSLMKEDRQVATTQPYPSTQMPQTVPVETIVYDPQWFKPLNLTTYLFRNGLLARKKPFFDSDELEIRMTQRQNSEFTLTFKNKTKRELRISCTLHDDENYVFEDSEFRQKLVLHAGKTAQTMLRALPSGPTHRYPTATLRVNGKQAQLLLPITVLSYCIFQDSRVAKPFEAAEAATTQNFQLDYHILSPQEYFSDYIVQESDRLVEISCWASFRINPSLRVQLRLHLDKPNNSCQISCSYGPQSKELAMYLLRVLLFCWKLPA